MSDIKYKKHKISFWSFIFLLCLAGINCLAITASNLSIYPNPVSPGSYSEVTISFVLADDPSGVDVKTKVGGVEVQPNKPYAAGTNIVRWSVGADGIYNVEVSIDGTPIASGKIIVDSQPPIISNVAISPNPFSPNNDGINDYVEVNFDVTRTFGVDEGFLGQVIVTDPGPPVAYTWGSAFEPYNVDIANVTGARLAVVWNRSVDSTESKLTFKVHGAYKLAAHTSELELNPGVFQITEYFYTNLSWLEIDEKAIAGANPDEFYIFWIAGDASVNILRESGERVISIPAQPKFMGEIMGRYFVRWGGDISEPDGKYICKILVTDAAGNISTHSGIVLLDNNPIVVEVVSADTMIRISPESKDGLFDNALVNFILSEPANVTAKIYDINNNLIRTILTNKLMQKGNGQVIWDGKDDSQTVIDQSGEALYNCVITAVDQYTGDTAQVTIPIIIDNKPPDPPILNSIKTPTNATQVVVAGTAELGAIVEIYRDGALLGEVTADNGSFLLTVDVKEGFREFTARAIDIVGNKGDFSEPVQVLVDRTPPTGIDTSPEKWNKSDTSITIKSVDNPGGAGIVRIQWEYTSSNGGYITGKKLATPDANGKYPQDLWDEIVFTDEGVYIIEYFGVDAAGNISPTIKVKNPIRIDKTNPNATILKIEITTTSNRNHRIVQFKKPSG